MRCNANNMEVTMYRQITQLAAFSALLLTASQGAASTKSHASKCVFDQYAALSAVPYNVEENFGYGTYPQLRGAQLYVQAREGLTAEWLTLEVQRALSSSAGAACKPGVSDIRVSVVSSGAGFWVQLSADNRAEAAALLSWAQKMVGSVMK
jgi:hypothetical protein